MRHQHAHSHALPASVMVIPVGIILSVRLIIIVQIRPIKMPGAFFNPSGIPFQFLISRFDFFLQHVFFHYLLRVVLASLNLFSLQ